MLDIMKWLNYFSIKQKLAILLFFLLSAVSYLTFSTINATNQQQHNNTNLEVAQQQHLIVEQFINAFFYARQQALVSGEKSNHSELNKNQFLFEQNSKAMLFGGKTYLDLAMKTNIKLQAINAPDIQKKIKESQKLWNALQTSSQGMPLKHVSTEQLDIFHHIHGQLRNKLTNIVTLLTQHRDRRAHQDLITLQLSWLTILIMGTLFSWSIARNITQPLEGIAQVTSRIRRGDLQSYPDNNTHHDELGTLFYQADEMRQVFSELMLNIQQQNKQILHSSTQTSQLGSEMETLQQQQYDEQNKIVALIQKLQKNNIKQLKLLAQHGEFNLNTQQLMTENKHIQVATSEHFDTLLQTNIINTQQLTNVSQSAQQLENILSDIEGIACKTEGLAQKATIEAARSGQHGEKFTLVANQVSHLATKTAKNIASITPLITEFQSQITLLSSTMNDTEQQLNSTQRSVLQSNLLLDSLQSGIEKQQQLSEDLSQQNLQQSEFTDYVQFSLESLLQQLQESTEKTQANNLFMQELSKVSLHLEALSQKFKLDEKENRVRRGNDKRLYPRIDNHLNVLLQQGETTLLGLTQDLSLTGLQLKSMKSVQFNDLTPVSFTIDLPHYDGEDSQKNLKLLGDVVHYEQMEDNFFYGVHFHDLNEQQKDTLQTIFNYFDKKSEFKARS